MPESKFHRASALFEDIQYELRPRLNYFIHGRNVLKPESITDISFMRRMVELSCKIMRFCLNDLNESRYTLERSVIYSLILAKMMSSLKVTFNRLTLLLQRYDELYPLENSEHIDLNELGFEI